MNNSECRQFCLALMRADAEEEVCGLLNVKDQGNSPPPGPRYFPTSPASGGGRYCRVFGLSFFR